MNSRDGEVEVSFMTKGKGKAAAPVPVGKISRRLATNELIEQRDGSYKV